jgi:hypothetical protein
VIGCVVDLNMEEFFFNQESSLNAQEFVRPSTRPLLKRDWGGGGGAIEGK